MFWYVISKRVAAAVFVLLIGDVRNDMFISIAAGKFDKGEKSLDWSKMFTDCSTCISTHWYFWPLESLLSDTYVQKYATLLSLFCPTSSPKKFKCCSDTSGFPQNFVFLKYLCLHVVLQVTRQQTKMFKWQCVFVMTREMSYL